MTQDTEKIIQRAWHDLGAPLRAIRLLVDMTCEDREPLGPRTRENLTMITQRADRAESLLDQLRDFVMLRVKPEQPRSVDTDVVSSELIAGAGAPGFVFRRQGHWPQAVLPANAFRAGLSELLTNATKHHGGGAAGDVLVSATADDRYLCIEVRDNGKGIDERFHEAIFEFGKTLQSQDQVEGNGMGLTLLRATLAIYGGDLSVRSKPGEGACFAMRWALHQPSGD